MTFLKIPAENILEKIPQEKTLSIIELITNGGIGGNIIMFTLLILSIITIYVYMERIISIKKSGNIDNNFMNNIKDFIHNGKMESALDLCAKTKSPIARLIEKGISRIGKPLNDINSAVENVGKLEIFKLEKNINGLATIAGAAPMLGFLGTVIGMIIAFHDMASAGGQIDVEMLSTGIYTAMTTTVAGLIVGIIAFVMYNVLVGKVDKVIHKMEAYATDFMDMLNEPA